jgi:hypothetical protein
VEEGEVEKQFMELPTKGFICNYKSPYGAPMMLVKRKDGSMGTSVLSCALNKDLTIEDKYLFPCTMT